MSLSEPILHTGMGSFWDHGWNHSYWIFCIFPYSMRFLSAGKYVNCIVSQNRKSFDPRKLQNPILELSALRRKRWHFAKNAPTFSHFLEGRRD